MAKLGRFTQLIFGSTAGTNQMAEFGSFAAGTPMRYSGATITPTIIQTLANYLTGWFGAVVGGNAPAIEDMNALFYLITFQLAYQFQSGIPEWDAGTTYFTGSMVNSAGTIYTSLQDNNINQALSVTAYWATINNNFVTVTTSTGIAATTNFCRSNSTSGSLTQTLPTIASTIGKTVKVKDVGTGGNTTTVQGNGTDTIDGSIIYPTPLNNNDSMTFFNNGTSWDVI